MAEKIVLTAADQKRIAAAVEALGGGEVKAVRAHRWLTKAVKMSRGLRKTSMAPGEDGPLTDKERSQLLLAAGCDQAWAEANSHRLGFAPKVKPKAAV